jgi:hypothetical protein
MSDSVLPSNVLSPCCAVPRARLQAMVSLTNIIPTVTEKEAGYLAMFLGLALLKIQVHKEHASLRFWCTDRRQPRTSCRTRL